MSNDRSTDTQDIAPPTLSQVIGSVAAAFFGVQQSHNRKRDFTSGRAWHYIAVGALMTVAVILGIYGVAQLALWMAMKN